MSDPVKKQENEGEEELQTIANSEHSHVVLKDGVEVKVLKCKLRHAPAIARLARTVLTHLNITNIDALDTFADINDPTTIAMVVEFAYSEFVAALSQMTTLTPDQVEDLELDDAIVVGAKVVEVNQSFFSNQVSKALQGLQNQGKEKRKENPSN